MYVLRQAVDAQIVVLSQRQVFLQEALLGDGKRESGVRDCESGRGAGSQGLIMTTPADACVFCQIANRRLPADIVAEAPGLLAVTDLHPQAPLHVLILPTAHIPTLADVTPQQTHLLGEALQLANRLAHAHPSASAGYRVVVNCGAQAGQSVWHLHVHLLAGRPMAWPPG